MSGSGWVRCQPQERKAERQKLANEQATVNRKRFLGAPARSGTPGTTSPPTPWKAPRWPRRSIYVDSHVVFP